MRTNGVKLLVNVIRIKLNIVLIQRKKIHGPKAPTRKKNNIGSLPEKRGNKNRCKCVIEPRLSGVKKREND